MRSVGADPGVCPPWGRPTEGRHLGLPLPLPTMFLDCTLDIKARGAWLCARRAAPLMGGRRGRIVNISSLGSGRVLKEYVAVGVSKAALESLTRYLAVEFAPLGIAVNAVAGGLVETDALRFFEPRRQVLAAPRTAEPQRRTVVRCVGDAR